VLVLQPGKAVMGSLLSSLATTAIAASAIAAFALTSEVTGII